MRKRASKFEIFIDNLVPYALFLIIVMTIGDLLFSKLLKPYYWIVDLIDLWIIWIFAMDLVFKFEHAKSIPYFLKHYWIYIIGVFPFFLVVRVAERFYHISASAISSPSTIIIARYVAGFLNETRLAKFTELFRFFGASSRFIRAIYFYENPKVRHKINVKKLLKLKTKKR
jgi:hypothetical protein